MKKDSGFLLLVIIVILSYFIFRGKLFAVGVSPGKKFYACNPCDFRLSVGSHQFQFNNVTLKATITESSTATCQCVMNDCFFMSCCYGTGVCGESCGAPGTVYVPECNPCYSCGDIVRPDRHSCIGCGNYVNVHPNSVTVTLGGSTIYTWNGGDLVGYSINIADKVNSMCIDAATDCYLTIYAQSGVNQGGIQFAVETETYSSIPAVTTTTTPIIITTTIPGGTSGICI